MTYATVMVNLELGRSNANLLRLAGKLADRFHARVIGVAACQPVQTFCEDPYFSAALVEQDRKQIAEDLATAEADFRRVAADWGEGSEWSSKVSFAPVSDWLAKEARKADLVITGILPMS